MTEGDSTHGGNTRSPLKKSKVNPETNDPAVLQVKDHNEERGCIQDQMELTESVDDDPKPNVPTTGGEQSLSERNGSVVQTQSSTNQWSSQEQPGTMLNLQCQCGSPCNCITKLPPGHLKEKFIYLFALATVVVLVYCTIQVPWFLPYYYCISLPLIIIVRYVQYFKQKYQFFLLDFCYFANLFIYIFLWAFPTHNILFMVMFALSNGPLMSAVLPYRNSLVFHDYDKMTSVYIHVVPSLVSFCIRWHPTTVSKYWYRPFVTEFASPSFLWLVAVPLAGFVVHFIFYHTLVRVCIRPKEGFIDTYSYLVGKQDGFVAKISRIFGPRVQFFMFSLMLVSYCAASLLLVYAWYQYYIAHCVFVVVVCTIVTWNGGNFYIDVFGRKGFRGEENTSDGHIV